MNQEAFELQGEIALISGGSTSLAVSLCHTLSDAGARVIWACKRDALPPNRALSKVPQMHVEEFDEKRADDSSALLKRLSDKIGAAPTILVNQTSFQHGKPALDTTDDEFLSLMNTHVTNVFALTRTMAKPMLQRGHGSILFIITPPNVDDLKMPITYAVVKEAYLGIVRTLATELSPEGVRVNAVIAGFLQGDPSIKNDPRHMQSLLSRTPMKHAGTLEDISHAALYLCSPAAKYVTGVALPVDGGTHIGF